MYSRLLTERVFRRGLGRGPVIPVPSHQSRSINSPRWPLQPPVRPPNWTPPTSPTSRGHRRPVR